MIQVKLVAIADLQYANVGNVMVKYNDLFSSSPYYICNIRSSFELYLDVHIPQETEIPRIYIQNGLA